ncbi:hypothetical protein E8A29_03675 [Salmonella enterica]|nr:hypothetical protein [Salmonella enterica]EAV6201628.1 hypothetical protein [Salmonella enterica]
MFYLYPIVKGSANCDTVCGFDNTFHGMIHPSVNTRKKIGRMGRFRLLLATVGTISGFTVYHRYFSLSGFSIAFLKGASDD